MPVPPENPYQPPASEVVDAAPKASIDELRAELRAYVGYGHRHYVPRWEKLIAGGRGGTGFCWGACLFGFFFFLYRRMYVVGFLLLFLESLVGVFLLFVQGFLGVPYNLAGMTALLFALLHGIFGYQIYFSWAQLEIGRAKEGGLKGPDLIAALRRSNGPNYWLPVLLVFGGCGGVGLIASLAQ